MSSRNHQVGLVELLAETIAAAFGLSLGLPSF